MGISSYAVGLAVQEKRFYFYFSHTSTHLFSSCTQSFVSPVLFSLNSLVEIIKITVTHQKRHVYGCFDLLAEVFIGTDFQFLTSESNFSQTLLR